METSISSSPATRMTSRAQATASSVPVSWSSICTLTTRAPYLRMRLSLRSASRGPPMSVVQAKIRPDSSTTSAGNMVTRPRNPSKPALRMRRSFCGIVHSPRLSP